MAARASRIAVLPVGYYEGYDRGLSGIAHVLVRGKRAPIRGRVCMNMCMADVTDVPGVALEDEVVVLGREGAYVRVRTPDGLEGWAHRRTLTPTKTPPAPANPPPARRNSRRWSRPPPAATGRAGSSLRRDPISRSGPARALPGVSYDPPRPDRGRSGRRCGPAAAARRARASWWAPSPGPASQNSVCA